MKKVDIHHCKHCGKIIDGRNKKYCSDCSPIAEKEGNRRRSERYREKHREELRLIAKKWRDDHPEEKRLHSRNYIHRHPDLLKQKLMEWRKNNPDKVKAQNKRAKKKVRHKRLRVLNTNGRYPKFKWPVACPKCNHHFKTSAKRPQCNCGYSFPRDFMEKLIDNAPTKPCKTCGREIPYPGEGTIRKYCECCFPQITALKAALSSNRFRTKNPDHNKEWYRNNTEIIAASTCCICGEIIPYKRIGCVPILCEICAPRRELNANKRRSREKKWSVNTYEFIQMEKKRLWLDQDRKWTKKEINRYYNRWKDNYPQPSTYEDDNMVTSYEQ